MLMTVPNYADGRDGAPVERRRMSEDERLEMVIEVLASYKRLRFKKLVALTFRFHGQRIPKSTIYGIIHRNI